MSSSLRDDDDPQFGKNVPDRVGDIGGGNVAVVEALVVAALLDVADATPNLGQLLPEIQLHRSSGGDIGSRNAPLDGSRYLRWARLGICAPVLRCLLLSSPASILFQEPLGAAALPVRLPSLQRSLQQQLEFGLLRFGATLDRDWFRLVLVQQLKHIAVFVDVQPFLRFDAGNRPANQGRHFSFGGFANCVPLADTSRSAPATARVCLGFNQNAEIAVEVIKGGFHLRFLLVSQELNYRS